MNRVIYFNINYVCNNHCLFCFSSSTSMKSNREAISCQEIFRRLNDFGVNTTDLIVINGGEPTIHPEFYKIMGNLTNCYNAAITVYTNGVSLDVAHLPAESRIMFVVPIHGPATIHNEITRNPVAFKATLTHLRELGQTSFRYALKFIINEQIIQMAFDIGSFLKENELCPCEVVLARMNETKISRKNHYNVPQLSSLRDYLNCQIRNLHSHVSLKLLDIPPCLVDAISTPNDICAFQKSPQFYFNDPHYVMKQRAYYKQVKLGNHCMGCLFENICTIMSGSYLTLAYHKGWVLESE